MIFLAHRRLPATLLALGLFWSTPGTGLASEKKYQRSLESYVTPQVELINQDRAHINLEQLLTAEGPVMLDFIYATCTTICPVLSAGFSNLQKRLGAEAGGVRFVSISIDPEHDTPEIMREYLDRYRAKPGWDFLTGGRQEIDLVMHAFDAFVSNKMSHYPLILIKKPGTNEWVRIFGLIGTRDLLEEYRRYYPAPEKSQ
jgi:protein SCO1/2